MSRDAHFRVTAKMDNAGGTQQGTVTINRESGLVSVRPLRGRRTYTMRLSDIADIICQRVILHEVHEARKALKRAG